MTPLQKAIARADARQGIRTADYAVIVLPETPPSVNAMFNSAHKLTTLYRAWRTLAMADVMGLQRPPMVRGRVKVRLRFWEPPGVHDLDNLIKAPLDLLKLCRVIEDDRSRFVRSVHADWDEALANGAVLEVLRA